MGITDRGARRESGGFWSPALLVLGAVLLVTGLVGHALGFAGVTAFLVSGGACLVSGFLLNRRLRRLAGESGRDVPDVQTDMISPRDIPPGAPPPSTGLC
jgi:hypothetical protein